MFGKDKNCLLKKLIILCLITISTLSVLFVYNKKSILLFLLVTSVVCFLYQKMIKSTIENRTEIIGAIYTFLLAMAIVVGYKVHYISMRSNIYENYIDIDWSDLLTGIAFAVLLYPGIILLLQLINQCKISSNSLGKKLNNKKFFFVAWFVIFVAWIPYLLTFYPGGLVGDGAHTLEEALQEGVPSSNHWVVFYILTLKFFLWIGSFISTDINIGVFIYAVFESIVFAAICAMVATKIRRKGVPSLVAGGTVLVYALSGFFASYSMSLWKDSLFSAAVVLMVLFLWDMPEDTAISLRDCLKFGVLSLFICFWRNNGLYVLVLCLFGIAVLVKKQGIRLLLAGLSVVVITVIVQGPVYNHLGIHKDSLVESFSVPIQQVAAAINVGAELTDYQKEILYSMIPEEKWAANYCPTLSDDLKNSTDISYLNNHAFDFLTVWAQLMIPHFETYVKAYLMQMLGFWQPGVYRGHYFDYWVGVQDLFNRGFEAKDLIQSVMGISMKGILESNIKFIPSGTMVWIMFFSMTAVLCQNSNRKRRILALFPLFASWCVIMIAAPIAYAYRYIVMLPIAFPIIFTIPFCQTDTCENMSKVVD